MSDAAIESIQKNSNSMVFEINFIFLEDEMLKIWILGSDHCVVRPIKPISKILKENTSHANLKHDYKFGRPKRKNCPGNFCNFVIKSKARMDKDEMDYDDLLGEVRKVYFNGLEHEYTRMKLSMRSDYLLKERAIQNMKKLKNEIPYKYIILGRLLIEKSGISTNKKHLIEIDANQLRKSLFLKESEITTDLNDLK